LASLSSINRVKLLDENHFCIFSKEILASKFLFFALLDLRVLFFPLHRMEEGRRNDEGGGNSGRALVMRESSWCATLVVVMILLRRISCHDNVPPLEVTGGSMAPIGCGTCSGRLWVASAISQSSSHVLQASVYSDVDASSLGILCAASNRKR